MNRRFATLAVLAAMTSQMCISQRAQAQTGAVLSGRIVDASTGKPLREALVVVTSTSLQGEASVLSDASGFYRLPNLPAGIYNVQMFKGAYQPRDITHVALTSGASLRVNGAMLAEGSDAVNIEVTAPTIDVGATTSGMSMGKEFIRRVPLISPGANGGTQRSFEALAAAAPGAQSDSRGTSLAGATSAENTFRIEGVSVGSPRLGSLSSPLTLEFADEVSVVDGGYMPEFGRTTGGTITATVKSGGNQTHGHVWVGMNPAALGKPGKTVFDEGSTFGNWSKLRYQGDLGVDLGGKIIKDKLWYYVGFQLSGTSSRTYREVYALQQDDDKEPIKLASRSFDSRQTAMQAVSKLTYAVNQNTSLSLLATYMPTFDGDKKMLTLATNLNGSDSQRNRLHRDQVTDLTLRWLTSARNRSLTSDTKLLWHHESAYRGPRDRPSIGSGAASLEVPQAEWSPNSRRSLGEFEALSSRVEKACAPIVDGDEVFLPCPVRGYVSGGAGLVTQAKLDRFQLKNTSSYTFAAAGHHTLKAGFDLELLAYANHKAYTGGRQLVEQDWESAPLEDFINYGYLSAPNTHVGLDALTNRQWSPLWSGFLQDSWSIFDRVTLNAGLRYDGQFVSVADRIWVTVPVQLAPRVGLIWDPTQKGKSKFYVNYARFYQGLVLEMAEVNGNIEPKALRGFDPAGCADARRGKRDRTCLSQANALEVDGQQVNRDWTSWGATPTTVDPALKPGSADEVLMGAEYEVFPQVRAALAYRKKWMNRVVEDMSRDEGASYFLGNPGHGVASDFPVARRDYDALIFVGEKPMHKHWMLSASYTVAWLRGNYSGFIRPEIDQLMPNITSDFDFKSMLINRQGYLPGDHRHQIKVYGAGEIPAGERLSFDVGGAFEARSGRPTNYYGSHRLAGDNESFLVKRGSGPRTPWVFNVNTSLAVNFLASKKLKFGATLEGYNIFNFQAATAVDESYSTASDLLPLDNKATPKDLDKAAKALAKANGVTLDEIKNPNFGKASDYQTPRTFRFGLRAEF